VTKFLDVHGINAFYGDIQALRDVSLKVNEGEIVGLIGANGAGKTTLMRVISGLHPPSSGTVKLRDTALHPLPAHQIVEEGVILVPEGRRLFGGLSVLDNLELGAYARRARGSRFRTLKHVFELFPLLAERQGQRASTLSGGQQQMLAIGRALMGLPKLLMLDEPSLGLAPVLVEIIFEIVKRMNNEASPYSWWNRTRVRRWNWQTGLISSNKAGSSGKAPGRNSCMIIKFSRLIWDTHSLGRY